METDEDALNTLDGIVQSMEKEIATTKVSFEAVISQCYEGLNRTCQNPDSVSLEFSKLQNDFARVSRAANEELNKTTTIKELMEQRVSILKRLENASLLLSETASYQTVYAGCLEVDVALSRGQLQGAIDTIQSVRKEMVSIKQGKYNEAIFTLLQRASNRKFARVQAVLMHQLMERVRVTPSAITFSSSSTDVFRSTSLESLLSMVHQLDIEETALKPVLEALLRFGRSLLPDETSLELHGTTLSLHSRPDSVIDADASSPLLPEKLSLFTHFLVDSFFSLSDSLRGCFRDSFYPSVESWQLQWLRKILPDTIDAMNHVRPLLRPAIDLEAFLLSENWLDSAHHPIRDFTAGMELQWCEKHVEERLREFRRALRRPKEPVRVDLAGESGRFMFPAATEGVVAREFGSYRHVTVSRGTMEAVRLMHAIVGESTSLRCEQNIRERLLRSVRDVVMMVVMDDEEEESAFEDACVALSDFTLLTYELALIPYKYKDLLGEFDRSSYVCVDLIPMLRGKQQFYEGQIVDYLRAQRDVFVSGKGRREDTLEGYLQPYFDKIVEVVGVAEAAELRKVLD